MSAPSTPPPLSLRIARGADAPVLAALEAACFPSAWTPEQLAAELGHATGIGLLASHAEAPVGYALYRVAFDEAELLRLAVLPEWRRRGAARELLARGEAALRVRGCHASFLEVREENLPAIRLYESCGWRRVGRRARYYPDGAAALLYRRELA